MTETAEPTLRWLPQDSKWRRGPPVVAKTPPEAPVPTQAVALPTRQRIDPENTIPTERVSEPAVRKTEDGGTPDAVCTARGAPDASRAPDSAGRCAGSAEDGAPPSSTHEPLALTVSCKALGRCLSLVSDESERVEFLLALSGEAHVETLRR